MKKENVKSQNTKKMTVGFIAGIVAVMILTVGSIAYFTDRASVEGNVNVGNLQVELSGITIQTDEVITPGAIVPMEYEVSNSGSLALDEREKVALMVYESDGTTPISLSSSTPEFEIYNSSDVELVTGKGYAAKSGATPIGAKVTDGFTGNSDNGIIYQVGQTALNGSDQELGASEPSTVARDFVILFNSASGNEFQDVVVKINVLVEAKQHAHTSEYDDDWSELQSESITFNTGTQSVVPARIE